jgi:hypothetical protein
MPIRYAMIGKLAPKQYQGVMMGSWMLVTGLASLFAGDSIREQLIRNPHSEICNRVMPDS